MPNPNDVWGNYLPMAMANATHFFRTAAAEIDSIFGPGYAQAHSGLVACFMDICARHCEDAAESARQTEMLAFQREVVKDKEEPY